MTNKNELCKGFYFSYSGSSNEYLFSFTYSCNWYLDHLNLDKRKIMKVLQRVSEKIILESTLNENIIIFFKGIFISLHINGNYLTVHNNDIFASIKSIWPTPPTRLSRTTKVYNIDDNKIQTQQLKEFINYSK